ncbi:facilitated trehalose transporter Tret1 [Teleopsis dalmanni]|uniref:facilitated trehalose transporter Tret1 n=1 Tax=Teleopsis dalmanni TaxID=139649 RepID=UPI0018CCBD57|nr:facilitated trehalose transporter Tret1 [Teleopsis dalmanni]
MLSSERIDTTKPIVTEENSHLLETAANGDKYGSQQADQDALLGDNMVQMKHSTSRKLPQYIAALAAAGGALAAGTLLGWTNPAQNDVIAGKYGFDVSEDQFSLVGSFVTLGAACVCIPIGILINMIGRKLTMLLLVLPFTLGWCLLIWAQNVSMLYAARFILGVSGGAFCVTAPMYTGEIAEKDIRGTLGSFFQLMITAGILLVYGLGAGLNLFWLSVACGLIPLIFGAIFFFMPETPTYLVGKNKEEQAIKSIQWLRGSNYDYNTEIEELKAVDAKIKEESISVMSALLRPTTLKALFISLGLMFFQQLCGINAVIFYSTDIFRDAQTGIDEQLSTILVGVMQVIATFVSVIVVDKLGRRILLLASGSVMSISTIAMGVYFYMQQKDVESVSSLGWLPVCSLCAFIIMFSIGYGPVPWLMMGELFATDIKGVAGSLAGTTNWVLAFIVTKFFVNLKQAMGNGETFWLFAGITVVGIFFVFFFVPETKGKSLQEIQDILAGRRRNPSNAETNTPM